MKKIVASLMALLLGLILLLVNPVPAMAQTGEIQGIKWNDLNGDGIRQGSEPVLSEVKIYLDLNENRVFDPGEPSQITDPQGQYRFTGLQPDTYIVREVVPKGFSQTYPKPPKDENGATTEGSLRMIKPNPAVAATFIGNAGISTDGLGTTGSGTIQAEVPAGSTVEYAFLHIATRQLQPAQIRFNGQGVPITWLNNAEAGPFQFKTGRADVTRIVANKVGNGGGTFNFTVDETVTGNPGLVEGTSLTVIYSNSELPERTILVLEGGLTGPTPKTNTLYLNEPLDPTIPGFTAQMALGIQFGVLNGTQYSTIDVNGKRLTSSAGDYDDGSLSNGQLVTVGGVGDSLSNPVNPASTTDKSDDELYDLTPFLTKGDASIRLDTANPSNDDSIFLVAVMFPGAASAEERGFYEVEISEGTIAKDINFANLLTGNVPPIVVNPIPDQTATATESFSFTVASDTFSDANKGDSLTLSATLENGDRLPAWLNFNPNTGTFSGTPAEGDVGTISIEVTANDGHGGTQSDSFNLTVLPGNKAPVVVNPIDNQTATAGSDFSFPVPGDTFSDPDGDSLTLSATLENGDPLPDWLTFNPATGEFTGTPGQVDISSICITVTADDGNGGVTSDTFNAIVQSVLAAKETFINPDNGHIYFLTEALSWTEAQAEAKAVDGNLVTINDLEENDWLWGTFGTAEPFWIGLNDAAVEGSFEWVSGQDPDIDFYEYWSSTQPDSGYSGGEEEDYVVMNWRDYSDPSGGWGDVENAGPNYGEPVPGIVEVEPETLDYDLSVLQPEPQDCQ